VQDVSAESLTSDFTDSPSIFSVTVHGTRPNHLVRPARPPALAKRTRTRQDNTNLDELLEMELDDVFLVPKTMLEEVGASAESGEQKPSRRGGRQHTVPVAGQPYRGSHRRQRPRDLLLLLLFLLRVTLGRAHRGSNDG